MSRPEEMIDTFDCFGSSCAVLVTGDGDERSADAAVQLARRSLLAWHERFSRFLPDSELSLLNSAAQSEIVLSPLMARFVQDALSARSFSGGLVDASLHDQIEEAGYAHDLSAPLELSSALVLAPARRPAGPASPSLLQQIELDIAKRTITRPPGVKLDSGGLAKGLFADALAATLAGHPSFAVNCAGDLMIGGAAGAPREINVESPFDGRTLHTFRLQRTGVATSGIGCRSWLDGEGRPAHHLLDPSTGRPAFTGVVQVTALAPSALRAEILAKAAILGGPRAAPAWLRHGGVIVLDDGSHHVIEPPPTVELSQLSSYAPRPRTPARQAA